MPLQTVLARPDLDLRYLEFQSALMAVCWGIWFLMFRPFGFALGLPVPSLICLVIGLSQLTGLIFNLLAFRRIMCMVSVIWWMYLGAFFWRDTRTAVLVVPSTATWALGSGWGYFRLSLLIRRLKKYCP